MELTGEFATPHAQPVATLAWEDGAYISRDGLTLYSDYLPFDALKAIMDSFSAWQLSGMHGRSYNLGAPQGIPNAADSTKFDYFAYTDDTGGPAQIRVLRHVGRNPSGTGTLLPSNVSDPHSILDNPQLARSVDAGADEQQPHLFHDASGWWLYYSATNAKDGKLAIYCAKQGTPGNWDNWQSPQLVLSAGTTMGVGEPTLTASGDLSFVAIFKNPQGTSTDQYDSDPWYAPHR